MGEKREFFFSLWKMERGFREELSCYEIGGGGAAQRAAPPPPIISKNQRTDLDFISIFSAILAAIFLNTFDASLSGS